MRIERIEFPLVWPDGWPRTTERKDARYRVELSRALFLLGRTLGWMRAERVVLSTNVPLRQDGQLSLVAARSLYHDPGVAVYFAWQEKDWVLACDQFIEIRDNIRALGMTLDALRQIDRAGATQLLNRAAHAFARLPGETAGWHYRELGVAPWASETEIERAFRTKAKLHHPDAGGTDEAMARLSRAKRLALERVQSPTGAPWPG